jgi:hypothetical protein
VLLGEARLTALKDFELTIDQDAAPFAEAQAEWLDHECAGWVVQNCRWTDNFQRLLIMSGPGTVRGCTFTRMGSGISLNTGMGLVGGIPSDITIADNTFVDVNPRPYGATVDAVAHNARGQEGVPPIERLVLSGNSFIRSGGPALRLVGIQHSRIFGNRFEACAEATRLARPGEPSELSCIELRAAISVEIDSNTHQAATEELRSSPVERGRMVRLESCRNITLDSRLMEDVPRHPKAPQ